MVQTARGLGKDGDDDNQYEQRQRCKEVRMTAE
jgi:hypothetical protein